MMMMMMMMMMMIVFIIIIIIIDVSRSVNSLDFMIAYRYVYLIATSCAFRFDQFTVYLLKNN